MTNSRQIEIAERETSIAKGVFVHQMPELLAPAGDWECAKAAVENGADAIYFGLDRFNARMRAHNFTEADLPKLMEHLHGRGVKGYVTFNTLICDAIRLPPHAAFTNTLAGRLQMRLKAEWARRWRNKHPTPTVFTAMTRLISDWGN